MKNYLLKLADDSLIMGQRLAEWCGKGPYLEEDIALTNIALDYLGQASLIYKYAVQFHEAASEDELAFLRYENEYLNAQLTELPNGDYAQTLLKVYFFSVYQRFLYENLLNSTDQHLSAIAEKSLKEVKYHYIHAKTWLTVFGNGTDESRLRLQNAQDYLWEYTYGLFEETPDEHQLFALGISADGNSIYEAWKTAVSQDFNEVGLSLPESTFMQKGSRKGIHTEYFGYILCELQYMQRAYPGCEW